MLKDIIPGFPLFPIQIPFYFQETIFSMALQLDLLQEPSSEMQSVDRIGKKSIRRLFYIASLGILITTAALLVVPVLTTFNIEYRNKVTQLSNAIIQEKSHFMEMVISEKISDIERIQEEYIEEFREIAPFAIERVLIQQTRLSSEDYLQWLEHELGRSEDWSLLSSFDYLIIDKSTNNVLISTVSPDIVDEKLLAAQSESPSTVPALLREDTENLVISVFLTDETLQSLTQESAKEAIRETQLPDNGYIWINHILDYGGGEGYAIRLVHPNLPDTEGMLLSTAMEDIKGNRPYLEELTGIRSEGEITFDYFFKKKDSEEISHKLSYAKLYKPYDWVIATGVYLDDVDELIREETILMGQSFRRQIGSLLIVLSVVLIGAALMIILFEKRLQFMISSFEESVRKSNSELAVAYRQIEDQAYRDFLTGLWNRRAMYEKMEMEVSRSRRNGLEFCLIMGDIDNFKHVNDRYGHDTGDSVLKKIAGVLESSVRREDYVARWGGEEFLIMIPAAVLEKGLNIAEKIRLRIEETEIKSDTTTIRTTITFGVAVFTEKDNLEDVITAADRHLYVGKKAGRNRVSG